MVLRISFVKNRKCVSLVIPVDSWVLPLPYDWEFGFTIPNLLGRVVYSFTYLWVQEFCYYE